MTTRPTKYKRATMVAIASGAFGASLLIAAVPAPARTLPPVRVSAAIPSEAVTVSVTQVGTKDVELDSRGRLVGEVLIYGSGQAKLSLGSNEPQPLIDTIRLKALPAFSADVTNGDVHVELRGSGTIQLVGSVTGGPAANVSATGNHLVLMQGGTGVRTIAAGELNPMNR